MAAKEQSVTKGKKVLFFFDNFRIGGTHLQLTYLIEDMKKDGFEPVICTHLGDDGGNRDKYVSLNVPIYNLARKSKFDLSIFSKLRRVITDEKIEIIVLFMPHNFFYYRLIRPFIRQKVHQVGLLRAMGFWLGHKNAVYQMIDNFLSTRFIRTSDTLMANSAAIKKRYDDRLRLNADRIKVIYNSSTFAFTIGKTREQIRSELGIGINEFMVIMVARLDPWKDFDTLFNAAKLLKEKGYSIRFVVCGDGELRKALEEKIAQAGLNAYVILAGEKKNVHDYINAADISVLTTKGEGFSNSIMESMALGKTVIASDVGGNAELIGRDMRSGFLIKSNDHQTLAEHIIRLSGNDALLQETGSNARTRIWELCDRKRNSRMMIEQFHLLANGK